MDEKTTTATTSTSADAEKIRTDTTTKEGDFCSIEASVVTGFEECARGEAKEKFNVPDVKAARGKITWKIPIDSVSEVVKMGSIDNCRVVIHSIPHFQFSSDQHESLASLQKHVMDFDWATGLKVWNKFNDFPHPIASVPVEVPSAEDLVDVVIIQRPVRQEKSENKKNKKGKWKNKKEQRKNKSAAATSNGQETDNPKDTSVEQTSESDGTTISVTTEPTTQATTSTKGNVTVDENGTQTVVIKQTDPSKPSLPIEIKVLIPGPDENAFPIDNNQDINKDDERNLEPMEVDRSILQNPDETCSPSTSPKKEVPASPKSPSSNISSPSKQPSAAISIVSAAKDFASSVIERLTSKSPSIDPVPTSSEVDAMAKSAPSCATPPPTPVQQTGLDAYMKDRSETAVDVKISSCVDGASSGGFEADQDKQLKESVTDSSRSGQKITSPVCASGKSKAGACLDFDSISIPPPPPPSQSSEVKPQEQVQVDVKSDSLSKSSPVKKEEESKTKERDLTKPTFRVTCNRVGDHHSFDSSSAAASLGSAIIRYFGWSVDLKNYDIEVLLNIDNEEVTVGMGITRTSLHNRNLVAFGPTTLRATICYNMMRLCRIRNGDFVCDPLCGTSAIPIEGSLSWKNCFFFGGDYHEIGIGRSLKNIDALRQTQLKENRGTMKIDTIQWNIDNFPLRDKCVDVFVSDLPFGHRMGSRTVNRTLYPNLLSVMARTARTGARACLLTEDKTSLIKALHTVSGLWQRRVILSINMGGLSGFVFLLTRTTNPFHKPSADVQSQDIHCNKTAASPHLTQEEKVLDGLVGEQPTQCGDGAVTRPTKLLSTGDDVSSISGQDSVSVEETMASTPPAAGGGLCGVNVVESREDVSTDINSFVTEHV